MHYALKLRFSLFYPVSQHGLAIRSKHAFRVELYAVYVILTMAQCHYLPFVALGGNLKAGREVVFAYHP